MLGEVLFFYEADFFAGMAEMGAPPTKRGFFGRRRTKDGLVGRVGEELHVRSLS